MSQIRVLSVEALGELGAALASFSGVVQEVVAEVEQRVNWVLDGLESAAAAARSRVDQASEELSEAQRAADDETDNTGAAEASLAAAEAALEGVQSAIEQVREAHGQYRQYAAEFEEFAGERSHSAREFLQRKAEALLSAAAIMPGSGGAGRASAAAGGPAAPATGAPSLGELLQTPLPAGFVWVPLARIDLEHELREVRGASDFREHASYDEIARGFSVLQGRILPALRARTASSDACLAQDQAAGASYEAGSQRVFDAFFSTLGEPIALARGTSSLLAINNGRHRIKVAHDLGWLAVPVRETASLKS